MFNHSLPLLLAAFAASLLFSGGEASAKGIIVINWGSTISPVGIVPSKPPSTPATNSAPDPRLRNPLFRAEMPKQSVGFVHSYFSLFWLDLATWNGTYCVYGTDRSYEPISKAKAAELLGKDESDLTEPFAYRVPLGWLVYPVILYIWYLVTRYRQKQEEKELAQLGNDSRFLRAIEIVCERYGMQVNTAPDTFAPKPKHDQERLDLAFAAGVEHLVSVGLARDYAEPRLMAMVDSLLYHSPEIFASMEPLDPNGTPATSAAPPLSPTPRPQPLNISELPRFRG